jgi:hypothetical protein
MPAEGTRHGSTPARRLGFVFSPSSSTQLDTYSTRASKVASFFPMPAEGTRHGSTPARRLGFVFSPSSSTQLDTYFDPRQQGGFVFPNAGRRNSTRFHTRPEAWLRFFARQFDATRHFFARQIPGFVFRNPGRRNSTRFHTRRGGFVFSPSSSTQLDTFSPARASFFATPPKELDAVPASFFRPAVRRNSTLFRPPDTWLRFSQRRPKELDAVPHQTRGLASFFRPAVRRNSTLISTRAGNVASFFRGPVALGSRSAKTADCGSIGSMADIQLYTAVGLPVLLNAAMVGMLMAYMNATIDGLRNEVNAKFEAQTQGLLRIEGVIDTRLKHLEEREK